MEKEIKLPKVAEGAESAIVSDILVKEGDTIEKGQSVIVVESDKASVEVPSEEAGKVKAIHVKKDAEIKPDDVILILETEEHAKEQPKENGEKKEEEEGKEKPGEKPKVNEEAKESKKKEEQPEPKGEVKEKAKDSGKEGEKSKAEQKEKKEEQPPAKQPPTENGEKKEEEKGKEEPGEEPKVEEDRRVNTKESKKEEQPQAKEKPAEKEVAAAPNVLRLARELGINVNDVKASGPQGKILEEDVTAYAKEIILSKLRGADAEESLPDFSRWGEIEKSSLKSIRRSTAKKTATSWRIIPHVTHFDEAEISKIEELRKDKNHLIEKHGGKLTVTAILLKILAEALKEFPKFNASIDIKNKEIILRKYINIGVAVDTERGLLVPVVRDVDKKNLISLSVELTELSEKARNGKLSADEMNGGGFVISNVGGIGGNNFTQLIYHPQVAILGIAKAAVKPVFIDGEFKPKLMLPLSLSYDHRLIDGADAARFLRWTCDVIENPLNLFIEESS
jgi:pyruvate dehydrogenase E2 component (dihydrolipoamide acetyltransferase)